MNDTVAGSPAVEYKDRRTGLILFGIVVVVIGCLAALMAPLLIVAQVVARSTPGVEPSPPWLMAWTAFMYLGIGVTLAWLGIGSTLCRRWARALLLIVSWLWLLGGIVGSAMAAFILPKTLSAAAAGNPQLQPEVEAIVFAITLGFLLVFFVLVPAVLVLFYRSRHVKATCAARDPRLRWTDACPLPVLAVSLLTASFAVFSAPSLFIYGPVVPFFGLYLTGAPAVAAIALAVAIAVWTARATYRLQLAGWWVLITSIALAIVSTVITWARLGVLPMYRHMKMPPSQLELMEKTGVLQSGWFWAVMAAFWIPAVAFVLYTRRFFPASREGTAD